MELVFFVLAAFGGSVLAGTLGALLGLGGGIIVIPLLTLLLGVDIHYAIGASLIAVIATSSGAASAYLRDGFTNRRLALFLLLGTSLGAVSGALAARLVGARALYLLFALVIAFTAVAMLRRASISGPRAAATQHPWARRLGLGGGYVDAARGGLVSYNVARVPPALAIMYFAGLLSGLLGIGGGVLQVPTMDMIMRLPFKAASATSNYMIGLTGVASAGVYLARGDIVPVIAGPVALGVLLGAAVGARVLARVRGAAVRKVFVVVLAVVAVQMAAKGLNLA
ncbi:MAG: sulfite exporter TauE/SafE family protein [Chloroflexota bacterium]